jgi:hypothetical protein
MDEGRKPDRTQDYTLAGHDGMMARPDEGISDQEAT